LRHGPDVRPDTAFQHVGPQGIGVISAVSQQNVTWRQTVEHIRRTAPVMGLTRRDLQEDRQAIGIDQGVDLGGQPTF